MSLLSFIRKPWTLVGGAVRSVVARIRPDPDRALLRTVRLAELAFQPRAGIKQLPLGRSEAVGRFLAPVVDRVAQVDASGPALLFIHGITDRLFGFALMPLYFHGDLLKRAHRAYAGRVYGYDHHTLSESPQGNAEALAGLLPDGLELDIVCHSRGGLVTRALLESAALSETLRRKGVVVRRVVFVGAASQGSDLAMPDQLAKLFRTFPLLAEAAAQPMGQEARRAADPLRKLLATVVGAASSHVARLPGVGALLPDSELIRALNDSPVPRTAAYSYVRSDFAATGLPFGELCRAAGVVFSGRTNDLVVPCDGAVNVGPLRSDPAAPVCELGHADQCHHLRYFELEKVQRFIAEQLEIAEPRAHVRELKSESHTAAQNGRDPPERYVGTGFAPVDRPGEGMAGTTTLAVGERYWFWLEREHSIETERTPFPREHLAVGTRLTVVLFVVPGGLRLDSQASSGVLQAHGDGSVEVETQPAKWGGAEADAIRGTLDRRLLFPVRTPAEPGDYALRCSIYHGQTLVQSRLVRAKVTAAPETAADALTSTLDYTLSRTLRPGYLEELPDHVLSLMVNRNQDGSHGFFFKGEREFQSTAAVAELKMQGMIDRARKSMRRASWKSEDEWAKGTPYRYQDGQLDAARLRDDLLSLAVAGLRLYDSIANQLADGATGARELRELMRRPGSVQIVNKLSPSFILPAALFYDYRKLDTGAPLNVKFELCPRFAQSLQSAGPLEEEPCFKGDCPSRDERLVVCPSGFWGFRHELGMPVSIRNAPEAPLTIKVGNAPAFAMAVYRDFDERVGHEQRLKALTAGWSWEYADTRDTTLELLENTRSQIVYFYCHGGMSNDAPYLAVGSDGEGLIHRETLDEDMRWTEPRPLVFINGCRTVAVEPEQAFEMVSALVESHNAAGVIGTEITVFEPLARAFAEAFFDRFLVQKRPLGEAVRGARLALLKQGNPLGLVYLPFALAGLRLEA